jgi:hypothetical protein
MMQFERCPVMDRLWLAGLGLAGVMFARATPADVAPPGPPGPCDGKYAGAPCTVGATPTDAGQPGSCQPTPPAMACVVADPASSTSVTHLDVPVCTQGKEGDPCQVTNHRLGESATLVDGTCKLVPLVPAYTCVALDAGAHAGDVGGGCALDLFGARGVFGPWLGVGSFAALVALLRRRRG